MNESRCTVCGQPVDESNSAICDGCGGRYHLNKRNDAPGKDCGDVRINDLYMSLEYGCRTCREGPKASISPQMARPARRLARDRPRRYRRRE